MGTLHAQTPQDRHIDSLVNTIGLENWKRIDLIRENFGFQAGFIALLQFIKSQLSTTKREEETRKLVMNALAQVRELPQGDEIIKHSEAFGPTNALLEKVRERIDSSIPQTGPKLVII